MVDRVASRTVNGTAGMTFDEKLDDMVNGIPFGACLMERSMECSIEQSIERSMVSPIDLSTEQSIKRSMDLDRTFHGPR